MAESTIESLNCQLTEMGSNESLTRAREHHDSVVTTLHHKHSHEIHLLNTKLDSLNALCDSRVRIHHACI